MDKFKICPVCHAKNSPAVLECVECGNDLMGVRIVDEKFLEEQKKTEPETGSVQTSELVRVCDCGAENRVLLVGCETVEEAGKSVVLVVVTPHVRV